MSVTSQLKDEASPLMAFMNQHLKIDSAYRFVNEKNRLLSAIKPIVTPGADLMRVGTAFSYYLRWYMQPMSKQLNQTAAGIGMKLSGIPYVKSDNIMRAISNIESPYDKAVACCVLSYFEEYARSGIAPVLLDNIIKDDKLLPAQSTVSTYSDEIIATIEDVRALGVTIASVFESSDVTRRNYISSPSFSGSDDVGGADAVMIVDGILFDVRCTRLRRPMTIKNLLQMIAYVLLDYHDDYQIKACAWYYARQKSLIIVPVENIISNLQSKREELASHLRGNLFDFPPNYQLGGNTDG